MTRAQRRFLLVTGGLAVLFAGLQLVPYGGGRTNPPVTGEPVWADPRTDALFARSCADCHSHRTRWPWYASVAPVSWLVVHDVEEGREHFNVSAWGVQERNEGDEAAEMIDVGEMPLRAYLLAHPAARLTDEERAELSRGLAATFGDRRQKRGRDDGRP